MWYVLWRKDIQNVKEQQIRWTLHSARQKIRCPVPSLWQSWKQKSRSEKQRALQNSQTVGPTSGQTIIKYDICQSRSQLFSTWIHDMQKWKIILKTPQRNLNGEVYIYFHKEESAISAQYIAIQHSLKPHVTHLISLHPSGSSITLLGKDSLALLTSSHFFPQSHPADWLLDYQRPTFIALIMFGIVHVFTWLSD